jgi:drug/metabolite transporter (DMT)-like permease
VKTSPLAISLMVGQAVLFAADTAMIHQIGLRASIMQLSLLRGIAGILLAFLLAKKIGWRICRTKALPVQLLRGVVAVAYSWVMLYSFMRLPFADATAISYTQVGYIAVFSWLILGEQVSVARWAAAAIGMIGAMFIVKPAFIDWNSAYLVALVGTSFNGLSFVLNKYVQTEKGDSELTTLFYVNATMVACNLPAAITLDLPDPAVLPWLSGVLLFGPLGMYFGMVAIRHANASTLGPYTLLRLVVALIGGVVVFHEMPDGFGLCGSALILGSCLLAAVPIPQRMRRQAAA